MTTEQLLIAAATLAVVGFINVFILIRNNFVVDARIAYINEGSYKKVFAVLPSYMEMLTDFRYLGIWTKAGWDKWLEAA